jgi:hypothetical protein
MSKKVNEDDPYYEEIHYTMLCEDPFEITDLENTLMKGYTLSSIIERVPDKFVKQAIQYMTPLNFPNKTQLVFRFLSTDQTNINFRKLYSFVLEHCMNAQKYTETQLSAYDENKSQFLHLLMHLAYSLTVKNYIFYEKNKFQFMFEKNYEFGYDYNKLDEFYKISINNSPFAQRLRQHKHTLFQGFS